MADGEITIKDCLFEKTAEPHPAAMTAVTEAPENESQV